MNTSKIKILLEAFYNGETNTNQDQILLAYFKGADVDEELINEKDIFLAMYQSEPIEVPSTLEGKLNLLIDDLAAKECSIEKKAPQSKKRTLIWIGSIAAGIAVLVSVSLFFNNNQTATTIDPAIALQQNTGTDNLSEADKKALKEAEDAIVLLSSKFNKGVNQLAVVSSNMDKTNEILNKSFNRKNEKES